MLHVLHCITNTKGLNPRMATYLKNLFGSMSYVDQAWAHNVLNYLIYSSALIGYIAGWFMESFKVTTYIVLGALALAALICVPNWRQRPDAETEGEEWLDNDTVRQYYERLDKLENIARGKSGGKKYVKHLR